MTIDGYICGRKTCKIHSYLLLERQFMRSGICIATTTTFFFIISQACAICINTLPNFLANPNEYNHYYVCVNNVTFFSIMCKHRAEIGSTAPHWNISPTSTRVRHIVRLIIITGDIPHRSLTACWWYSTWNFLYTLLNYEIPVLLDCFPNTISFSIENRIFNNFLAKKSSIVKL